ncbi:adenosine deaminase, partial [Francisella tularensis subsp. holarctica]|nr:adenosine deaminase [Francisella tularensis subsp. holarctica]
TKYSQIVGYDVAGMDIAGDVSNVLPRTIEFLRNNNVKFTVHSGEFSSISNIKSSILSGASRICHGCNLYKTKYLDILC